MPDAVEELLPPRQELMGVALVADVPDDLVAGRFEAAMDGDGQLDDAQVRRQMPARAGHRLQDALTNLPGQLDELFARQVPQV